MRKSFPLISVLFLALTANAKILDIAPNSPQASDNVRREIRDHISAGDTLRLADGTYSESEVILFDKSVTVIAANEAHPVIAQHYYSKITSGAKVKFIGITFDGSLYNSGAGANDHCFCPYDASDGNELRFENCEFKSFKSHFIYVPVVSEVHFKLDTCIIKNTKFSNAKCVIYNSSAGVKYFKMDGCEVSGMTEQAIYASSSASHMDSCIVNDCYFHENAKSAIYFTNSSVAGVETCDRVRATNSTFANTTTSSNSVITVYNKDYAKASTIKVIVDHCTFYNYNPDNTDHGVIRIYKSTDVKISNCIFAHPTSIAQKATSCYGGTITNNLVYNYTYTSSGHRTDDITPVANIVADPLFINTATGFSFAGDWTTMTISPARYAGTDGSDLGDPRWYSAETLPSTSFASAYDLLPTKAMLSGRIELNASNKIHFKHNADVADGTAKWKLHVGKSCIVSALVDVETSCTSGRQLTLTVKDADGNNVATLAQPSATYNDADINLGQITFTETGDYTFILTNSLLNSGVVLEKITLSYEGGAVQDIATDANTTLNVADAWFSAGGTRADGKIGFPDGSIQDGWVKWNINVESTKYYDITVNIESSNGHNYTVSLEDTDISVTEGGQTSAASPRLLGRTRIEAGQYTLKVVNSVQYSNAKLISVVFAPVGVDVTMDESDTDNSAWSTKVNDGNSYNVQIKRTIKAGMYNTLCLPFAVTSAQAREIFGEDVQLRYLESATVEAGNFVLNLEFTSTSGMYQGTPHLIKTSRDIVNPVFAGVQFATTSVGTSTGTNANFTGTFIKSSIPASENNLFLGAENTLYFPTEEIDILGMRAYFVVHDAPAGMIKRARIVENEQILTDIEIVGSQQPKANSQKLIENGQLIIVRDGVRYNVMGTKIQ